MRLQAGAIKVAAVFDADEVGDLDGIEVAGAVAGDYARWNCLENFVVNLFGGHTHLAFHRIGMEPGCGVKGLIEPV